MSVASKVLAPLCSIDTFLSDIILVLLDDETHAGSFHRVNTLNAVTRAGANVSRRLLCKSARKRTGSSRERERALLSSTSSSGTVDSRARLQVGDRTDVQYVDVDGCRVAHLDEGCGETIVFLHGISASLDYWAHNLPHFARRMRAVALDMPGFGRSDKPELSYTMSCLAGLVDRFLSVKGIERASLVGNSLGALVAVAFALDHPQRVQRLVLVNGAGFSAPMRWLLRLPSFVGLRLLYGMERLPWSPRPPLTAFRLAFRWVFPSRPDLADRFARAYASAARGEDYPTHLRSFMRAWDGVLRYPVFREARRIRVPTLLVWGGSDLLLRPAVARRFARKIADSRVILYERAGHCPMIDERERFNRDVEQFVLPD